MVDLEKAVIALVEHEGKVLVGKKTIADHLLSDAWHIPGGKVREDENDEQALVRELREEAGIEIKVDRFLDELIDPHMNFKVRWYLCSPLTEDLKAGGDLSEIKFVPKSEVFGICPPKAISLWPPKVIEHLRS